MRASPKKEGKKAFRCQARLLFVPSNPNDKWKFVSPYKTISQLEVPLPKETTRKRRLVLQSFVESKKLKVKSLLKYPFGLSFFLNGSNLTNMTSFLFSRQENTLLLAIVGGVRPSSTRSQGGGCHVIIKETNSPQEQSLSSIIEWVLGSFEAEGVLACNHATRG